MVGAFAGAILMGRVRAGKLDLITEISKSGADFVALAEFTATIHTNIFVWAGGSIVGEPLVEPVHRGGGLVAKARPKMRPLKWSVMRT